MIRYKDSIYTDKNSFKRSPKRKDLIKNELGNIWLAKTRLKRATDEKEIRKLNHDIDKARKEIDSLISTEITHKHKYYTNKYKKDFLKKLILEAIELEENDEICIEDYALRFKANKGLVSTIFQELIREGVISNKIRYYAHDTNRNPMFPMSASGWASNFYRIKNRN